jgi:hypothetical protein
LLLLTERSKGGKKSKENKNKNKKERAASTDQKGIVVFVVAVQFERFPGGGNNTSLNTFALRAVRHNIQGWQITRNDRGAQDN